MHALSRLARPMVLATLLGLVSACGGSGGGGGGGGGGGNTSPFTSPPNDPLFANQWHLENTGQNGATAGEDARVRLAWSTHNVTGAGVRLTVIDDGVEIGHEDLAANIVAGAGLNQVDNNNDPSPPAAPPTAHGTGCAGVAAGVGNNGIGISGAAPRAQLVGVRQSGGAASDATAMTHNVVQNFIYSMSYGPPEDGRVALTGQVQWDAVTTGITTGRNNLGAVYCRAAGNGGAGGNQPNSPPNYSNIDELNNHRGIISVQAVGADGTKANYGQLGSCMLISASTQGTTGPAITTTDQSGAAGTEAPPGNYTNTFNGTSSACPLVAGVCALMLEARPALTWRDVRAIIALTARKNNPAHPSWFNNGAGRPVSHEYGFGTVDANAAVALAKTFTLLPADQPPVVSPNQAGGAVGAVALNQFQGTFNVAGSGRTEVEHVLVTLDIASPRFRDLKIELVSPGGTTSILSGEDPDAGGYGTAFTGVVRLSTVLCLNEVVNGNWTLRVINQIGGQTHTVNGWTLAVYAH